MVSNECKKLSHLKKPVLSKTLKSNYSYVICKLHIIYRSLYYELLFSPQYAAKVFHLSLSLSPDWSASKEIPSSNNRKSQVYLDLSLTKTYFNIASSSGSMPYLYFLVIQSNHYFHKLYSFKFQQNQTNLHYQFRLRPGRVDHLWLVWNCIENIYIISRDSEFDRSYCRAITF